MTTTSYEHDKEEIKSVDYERKGDYLLLGKVDELLRIIILLYFWLFLLIKILSLIEIIYFYFLIRIII